MNINMLLMLVGLISFVEILQVKYLNNLIERDHRFIKKITNPMMGFKAFYSAQETLDGIETAHMIRKGQLYEENMPAYKQFMALAG
jgi:putative transposase